MIASLLRLILRGLLPLILAASALANIDFDPTFTASLPAGVELAEIVAVASDGSILLNVRIAGDNRIRLLADGSLDKGFTPPAQRGVRSRISTITASSPRARPIVSCPMARLRR